MSDSTMIGPLYMVLNKCGTKDEHPPPARNSRPPHQWKSSEGATDIFRCCFQCVLCHIRRWQKWRNESQAKQQNDGIPMAPLTSVPSSLCLQIHLLVHPFMPELKTHFPLHLSIHSPRLLSISVTGVRPYTPIASHYALGVLSTLQYIPSWFWWPLTW